MFCGETAGLLEVSGVTGLNGVSRLFHMQQGIAWIIIFIRPWGFEEKSVKPPGF